MPPSSRTIAYYDSHGVGSGGYDAYKYFKYIFVLSLVWAIPVLLTVLGYNQGVIAAFVILIGVGSLAVSLKLPIFALVSLPFFVLLAPTGGVISFFGVGVVFTDWYMLGLFAVAFLLKLLDRSQRSSARLRAPLIMLLFCGVYLVSYFFGMAVGAMVSLAPIYYLVCYLIIGFYFYRYAQSPSDWVAIVGAWLAASSLAIIVFLDSFMQGISLITFTDGAELFADQFVRSYGFRGAYYYSGFHFIVGALSAGLIVSLLIIRVRGLKFVVLWMLLGLHLIALYALFNKTAILSVILASIAAIIFSPGRKELVYGSAFTMMAFFVLLFNAGADSTGIPTFIWPQDTLAIFGGMESLVIRFELWQNAINELLGNIEYILVGAGPAFIESGNQDIAEQFKASFVTRQGEGALDSTWVTALIELGVIGVIVLVFMFALPIVSIFRIINRSPSGAVYFKAINLIYCFLLYFVIAFISQTLGYAKVSWFVFEMLLISFSVERYFAKRHATIPK